MIRVPGRPLGAAASRPLLWLAEEVWSIIAVIVMTTSIHIPKPLLEAVDRKARALKISRNRLIVRALERELTAGGDWSPGFFEQLGVVTPEAAGAVDELLTSVRQARTSKPPRDF